MTLTTAKRRDPNTFANYNEFITKHIVANFSINFEKEKLVGNVVLTLKPVTNSKSKEVILDTSYLDIKQIRIRGRDAEWDLLDRSEPFGSALKIKLESEIGENESVEIDVRPIADQFGSGISLIAPSTTKISLQTTENSTALQWLKPAQTSSKQHPFIFSQCQAIHARSIFPCQDTPAVKSTFQFNLRSPLPVIASGLFTGAKDFQTGPDDGSGTLLYTFKQNNPIPSYLFAIASGDIATAPIGPRSVVATGPGEIQDAKWEFEEDMERFIQAAEKIVYPYQWTTYNVLVLPPSFPYGGMENPVFTFATPTLISGDRQNVDVIAHELAHSWSGNLVSNASWEHFWLNEGWTMYLERRIIASIHGELYRDFSAIIGWKALSDSISLLEATPEFTKLVVNLEGKDPDDAFSSVPYEKGFIFLYHLETVLGKEKWDKFIPHYFQTFARKSLDSNEFKTAVIDFFSSDPTAASALRSLDWDTWFYAPGLPPKPPFDTSLVDVCYALATKWESRTLASSDESVNLTPHPSDISGWSANQLVVFMERVQEFKNPLSKDDVRLMDKEYGFSNSKNVELVSRFFEIGLIAKDEDVYEPTAELLGKVGRMKFVRPLYRHLDKVDRTLAVKTFEKHRDFYHPICRSAVEKDLFGSARPSGRLQWD